MRSGEVSVVSKMTPTAILVRVCACAAVLCYVLSSLHQKAQIVVFVLYPRLVPSHVVLVVGQRQRPCLSARYVVVAPLSRWHTFYRPAAGAVRDRTTACNFNY